MSRFEELDPSDDESSAPSSSTNTKLKPEPTPVQLTPPASSQNTGVRKVPKELDEDDNETEGEEGEGDTSVWWTPSELQEIIARSTTLKERGNVEFGQGKWEMALETYRSGLVELPVRTRVKLSKGKEAVKEDGGGKESEGEKEDKEVPGKGDEKDGEEQEEEEEDTTEVRELRAILFANVAACLIQLERWKEAIQACNDALEDNPTYMKAITRRAMASESLNTWSSLTTALEDYQHLETLPNVPPLQSKKNKEAIKRLPGKITIQQEKEKDEVLGKLKELGNSVLGRFGLNTDMFKFTQQEGGGYSMGFER